MFFTADSRKFMIEPVQIIDEGDDGLRIVWSDATENLYSAPFLRRVCACAQCVNEWTGERMLKPESVSDAVKIENIGVVGRYALSFTFSDGHNTGIFSFNYLHQVAANKKQTAGAEK
jgi:DUF971 family protein